VLRQWFGRAASALAFLALALAPFYALRFRVGPFPSTLLEVVLVLAIASGIAAAGRDLPVSSPYAIPGVLLLFAAALDTALAPDRRAAAGIWKAYFLEPLLAFLVITWLASSRQRVRLLLGGLAIAGSLVAAAEWIAFVQQVAGPGYDTVHPPKPFFLMTPNAVALFLIPLDAIALAVAVFTEERRERALAAAFFVVTVAAVLMCGSRGGELALAAVVVFVAAFHPARTRFVAAAALLAIILIAAFRQARERFLVELRPSDPNNTVALRLPLWQSTLRMLRANPVFGGGLDGFHHSVSPYRVAGFVEPDVNYPHNFLLTFWSETGIIGLIAFLWTLVEVGRTGLAGLRAAPWIRALSIGLLGALVAIVVHGLVDVPYFKNDLALEFWALLAIQYGALRSSTDPNSAKLEQP